MVSNFSMSSLSLRQPWEEELYLWLWLLLELCPLHLQELLLAQLAVPRPVGLLEQLGGVGRGLGGVQVQGGRGLRPGSRKPRAWLAGSLPARRQFL